MREGSAARAQRALQRMFRRPRALLQASDGLWDPADGGAVHPDFSAWCSTHPGAACELWVGSSRLADILGEDPDSGPSMRTDGARTAWARRVLHHYHGAAAALWPMLAWQAGGAWGASALRGVDLEAMQAQARHHGVVLRAVRPLWPHLLQRLFVQQPEVLRCSMAQVWLVEAGAELAHLTRISFVQGRLVALHRRRLQAPWAAAMQRLLDEEPPAPGVVPALLWLGPAPAGTLPLQRTLSLLPPYRAGLPPGTGRGPDFLQPAARPGALAWAWLGTCVVVLALSAVEAGQAWAARAQMQAEAQAFATLTAPTATMATTARTASTAPTRRAAAALATDPALQTLGKRLQYPWQAVFLASEAPATAGLRWLALDHRFDAELRLQGLADAPGPVQRAAATLREQPAWHQVLVVRLDTQTQGTGLAFEIVARLREAAP